jgi:hypothetical protein
LGKVVGYKISIEKSVALLYDKGQLDKIETKKEILIVVGTKKVYTGC